MGKMGRSPSSSESSSPFLTKAAADGSYQPKLGNAVTFMGDSVTLGGTVAAGDAAVTPMPSAVTRGDAYPVFAVAASGGQIIHHGNMGIAGQTSAQILARFAADVIARSPDVVAILAGTNDTGGSVPLATFAANIQAMVAQAVAAGVQPVLVTIPPNSTGSPANRKSQIVLFNNWLKRYARTNRIPIIDAYGLWVDPANGNYLAAYNNDGTHPNAAGQMALGQLFASKLASFLPARSPLLATDNNDPLNLITNALCQTSSAGLATGWVAYGSASTGTITPSIVTDAALPGSGQRGTVAAATGTMGYRTPRISTGYAVGDRLSFAGVVTSSGGVAAQIWIICNGAPSNNFQPLNSTPALTRQLFEGELIVPTGTTSIDFILRLPPGSGSTDLYQATCYNLTAQGIDTV